MKRKGKVIDKEWRRKYQAEYYKNNKEKCNAHQRWYSKTHKRARTPYTCASDLERAYNEHKHLINKSHTAHTLQVLPAERFAQEINNIFSGKKPYSGVR